MAILHIVRNSAFVDNKLNLCLSVISSKDTLFLMDDGVYNIAHPKLMTRNDSLTVYALNNHLQARGIDIGDSTITLATLKDLVSLSDTATKVITWQ
ncbi:sulfurtransferase complex subunit TusB [Thalassotalea psychrophila]|uniref:Sulfurtransferase complex subunit TusB n=1 Tax=Thalassotalea psychrophila TaxID=3065647 RepID=A0ABY9TS34_9GAMM|nr:sulfurtransferase complex subunit TusB [Colwelliaceae bacterium SQ149]